MAISHVESGDTGSQARAKMNAAIDRANEVDSKVAAASLTAEISARQAGDATNAAAVTAEASARQSGIAAEIQARQAGDATNAAAVTAEAQARVNADATERDARLAGDALNVKYSDFGSPIIRPGEPGDFFTGSLGGAPSAVAPIGSNAKAVSVRGSVARLSNGAIVAPRGLWGVEKQRQYRARFVFARSTDTEDADSDAVRLGLQWLRGDKVQVGMTVLADVLGLSVESGSVEHSFVFAATAADVVEFVAPAGTVYVRPFVRAFGGGMTDIETIEISDLSLAVNFSPDVSDLRRAVAGYDARTSIALERVEGVENGLGDLSGSVGAMVTALHQRITLEMAAEEQARIGADVSLGEDLAAEQNARILADAAHDNAIELEQIARANGDAAIIGGAPTVLNTLDKIAASIEDDPAFGTTIRAYIDGIIALQDAMVFKGVIDASANPNYPAGNRGWTYRISVAGKVGGASGKVVEVGDIVICLSDSTATGNEAAVGAQWTVVQTNIDGAVVGPASAVDGTPMVADGTSGKLLKNITYAAFKALLVLVKGDIGLGNVDNTSNATERAAAATLQNKTIDATANTITNLALSMFASGVIDIDPTLAANSNTKIAPQAAVKAYVDGIIEAANALQYKGAIDCSANPNYPAASAGHLYVVTVAGKIGGGSGTTVDAGDAVFCKADSTASGDQATVGASWDILQFNLVGALTAANIGSTVQAYSAILAAFVALTPSNDDILQRKAGAWTNRTIAQLGADLAPTANAITLANSWVDCGGQFGAATAWRGPDKRVVLEATITGGTTTGGTVVGTLPVGCRPAYEQLFVATTYSAASVAVIQIKPNGEISGALGLSSGITSLSGITFIAA